MSLTESTMNYNDVQLSKQEQSEAERREQKRQEDILKFRKEQSDRGHLIQNFCDRELTLEPNYDLLTTHEQKFTLREKCIDKFKKMKFYPNQDIQLEKFKNIKQDKNNKEKLLTNYNGDVINIGNISKGKVYGVSLGIDGGKRRKKRTSKRMGKKSMRKGKHGGKKTTKRRKSNRRK
jgi:hypothetical protein